MQTRPSLKVCLACASAAGTGEPDEGRESRTSGKKSMRIRESEMPLDVATFLTHATGNILFPYQRRFTRCSSCMEWYDGRI